MSLLAVCVVGCLALVHATPLRERLSLEPDAAWRQALRAGGVRGPALFVLVGALLVGVGFPRLAYSAIGGAAFGFVAGSLWALLGTLLGSMGCFWFARALGREWVERRWGARFQRLERGLREHGFLFLLLVRLCPVGNNFLANCLAGVSSLGGGAFFAASLLGLAPLTVVFALGGSGVAKSMHVQTAVSLILLVAISLAFTFYYRHSSSAAAVVRALRGRE
jgi:uncharacterized membrane protein YdjX (TVP38/TMEM64 family)